MVRRVGSGSVGGFRFVGGAVGGVVRCGFEDDVRAGGATGDGALGDGFFDDKADDAEPTAALGVVVAARAAGVTTAVRSAPASIPAKTPRRLRVVMSCFRFQKATGRTQANRTGFRLIRWRTVRAGRASRPTRTEGVAVAPTAAEIAN